MITLSKEQLDLFERANPVAKLARQIREKCPAILADIERLHAMVKSVNLPPVPRFLDPKVFL